jgi:hypothetical protein
MKDRLRRVAVVIWVFVRSRSKECHWSIYGFLAGAIVGVIFIGGIGIAALGTAVGLWAWVGPGFIGSLIGNRVGIWKDKSALRKEAAN